VVVAEMLGVVKEVPVPKDVPPVAAVYQFIVPEDAVAPNVTMPVPHLLPGVTALTEGVGFTVTATGVREADVHAAPAPVW
jgi:hypothetical protein